MGFVLLQVPGTKVGQQNSQNSSGTKGRERRRRNKRRMGITTTPKPTAMQGKASPGLCLALRIPQKFLTSRMVWAEQEEERKKYMEGSRGFKRCINQNPPPQTSKGTSAVCKSSPASLEATEQSQRSRFSSWKRAWMCHGMGQSFPSSTFPGSRPVVAPEMLLGEFSSRNPQEMIHVQIQERAPAKPASENPPGSSLPHVSGKNSFYSGFWLGLGPGCCPKQSQRYRISLYTPSIPSIPQISGDSALSPTIPSLPEQKLTRNDQFEHGLGGF